MRSAAIHRMLAGALPRHGAPRASLLALCSESAPSHLYCTRCSNPLGGDWDVGAAVAGLLGFSCLWEHVIQRVQSLGLQFSSVQLLSGVLLFATPWTAARQASLSITNCQSPLKLMFIASVMHPTISSSVIPFSSCPQSFSASGSFPTSPLFISNGQNIGPSASASVVH